MGRRCGVRAGAAVGHPQLLLGRRGTSGLDTVGGAIEALARARDPAGVALGVGAGVLKAAGAVLALALVRPGAVGCPAGCWLGLPGRPAWC
jgi:hypothetical protein